MWRLTLAVGAVLVVGGCAHTGGVYVPSRCIQKVKWSRPCEAVSESVVKCDGVMVTVSCVAVERSKAAE